MIMYGNWINGAEGSLFCYVINGNVFIAKDYENGNPDAMVSLPPSAGIDLNITFEV